MRGFNEKLFGDKLVAGQLPTQLGMIGSETATPLLLDIFPNAAAAYSLRKLRTAYTGSAIRVRRTDLTESDIGFTSAGDLDTTALLAFTGTGALDNGFIVTWYDQSGNSKDATQTTALSQPRIVSAGVLLTTNGKPSILSSSRSLTVPSSTSYFNFMHNGNTSNLIAVGRFQSGGRGIVGNYGGSSGSRGFGLEADATRMIVTAGSSGVFPVLGTTSLTLTSQSLFFTTVDADNAVAAERCIFNINGGSDIKLNTRTDTPSTSNATNNLQIGAVGNDQDFSTVNNQEIIFYSTNQYSNKAAINTNINTYYAIY
jgi:hypothetical protein